MPDPGDAATRRRRTTGIAAVTLTVAALGAGVIGMFGAETPGVPPAALASRLPDAPPSAAEVPPAAPSVSLDDSSWELQLWSVQPHHVGLHYGQNHRYGFEIDVHDGTAPRTALPAKPATAGQIADPASVTWQDGPDRWMRVRTTKPMTAAEMLSLLGKIRATPPVLASPLKSAQVPDGLEIGAFTSEPEANTLVLCPAAVLGKAPLDSRCFSMFVSPAGTTESASPRDPLPVRQYRKIGAYTVEINSSRANAQAALTLLNSVQLN
ncbi:hypothetical protein ABJI51_30200 [Amycolatopsis sp. NEAU-NG30]|uniref:Secreted protein n=1 Tax=Amycolatopsis melonis TaxID=3156488 RepID=A0ABV0LM47_9PSEU